MWEMHALLAKGIASGEVQPLPHTFYGRDRMQDALRYLASGARSIPPQAHPPMLCTQLVCAQGGTLLVGHTR